MSLHTERVKTEGVEEKVPRRIFRPKREVTGRRE
jgi:hypothetical protein